MSRIMLILYAAILLLIGGYVLFARKRDIAILMLVLGGIAAGLALVGLLELL